MDKAVKLFVDTPNRVREIEAMPEIPGPWWDLMQKQGITSIRELATVAGLRSHNVINPVIMHNRTTAPENMEKVARVLRVPVEELYGITSGVAAKPLSVPKGTELLTERQKDAVAELIRSMIEERTQDGTVESFVDSQKSETPESVPEKKSNVTALGGRTKRLPAEVRFEEHKRRVARLERNIPPHDGDTPDGTPKDS